MSGGAQLGEAVTLLSAPSSRCRQALRSTNATDLWYAILRAPSRVEAIVGAKAFAEGEPLHTDALA